MLSKVESLVQIADGRYASDQELVFFQQYLASANLRLRVYQKIQQAELEIITQVKAQVQAQTPDIFQVSDHNLAAKWQRDTVRVLRYSAMALLLDDADRLKETMLLWFQTIMRAFGAQESCRLTYAAMQDVITQYLTGEELLHVLPILELSRVILGWQPQQQDENFLDLQEGNILALLR